MNCNIYEIQKKLSSALKEMLTELSYKMTIKLNCGVDCLEIYHSSKPDVLRRSVIIDISDIPTKITIRYSGASNGEMARDELVEFQSNRSNVFKVLGDNYTKLQTCVPEIPLVLNNHQPSYLNRDIEFSISRKVKK